MSYRRTIPPFLGLLAVLVTACPGSKNQASARSFLSGTQLYSACNSEDDARWGECIGFINGVADILSNFSGHHEQIACFSYEKARDHLKDTVVFWLEQHPQRRHLAAASLVTTALVEAFPCKN